MLRIITSLIALVPMDTTQTCITQFAKLQCSRWSYSWSSKLSCKMEVVG